MKWSAIVLFTFLIAPLAGANVTKQRLGYDLFRISLTGQDAQRLIASLGPRFFTSSSSLNSISCLPPLERCEINLKDPEVQSYATIQEQLRLAEDLGIKVPQMTVPHDESEQLLTVRVEDSPTAKELYSVMPGPEVDFNLDQSVADHFSGKTKTIDLARGDFFMSCQEIERTSDHTQKGYSCLVNAVVPARKEDAR
ncbi:MAG: hypothetical protein ACXVA9_03940 [Bdellovibrionales bacterium]